MVVASATILSKSIVPNNVAETTCHPGRVDSRAAVSAREDATIHSSVTRNQNASEIGSKKVNSVNSGEVYAVKETNMSAAASSVSGMASLLPALRYEHFVAGISGGAVSTLMLHPLDLIKIRFAVNDGHTNVCPQYSGLRSAVLQITRAEGIRGLYKGIMPNLVGSGSSWGLYFFFYQTAKSWIQKGDPKKQLGPTMHMLAAANAGILSLIITNPFWVVKTRLCLQYATDKQVLSESKRYRGTLDAIMKIYKTEGVRGLYKGFVPGMFGVSHGAIQFMIYEEMKDRYNICRNVPIDTKLGALEYITFAATSKFIAAGTTYPYQVVRARLQDVHHNYKGSWDCISLTWRSEGIKGFYKGLSPYLIHVTPNICVIMFIHEQFTGEK